MRGSTSTLDALLRALPDEREQLRPYVERAERYKGECGCSASGAFLAATLGALAVYGLFFHGLSRHTLPGDALWAASLTFGAGVVGKLAGIGVARLRLAVMYRRLRARYQFQGA